jgi:outer membrane protein TolC
VVIPLLEQSLQENIAVLAVLIGRTPERVRIRGGTLNSIAVPRMGAGVPVDLLIQRPDIRQAEALLEAANANVHVARTQFLPSVNLSGQGGFQSALLRTLFTPEAAFYSLAAGFVQPIFHGGALIGNLEQQRARELELLNIYRLAIVSGITDVNNALVAVRQSAIREQLQRDVVTSSRQAFDIALTRLREGTVDQVTVLTTQQTLFAAQDNLINARLARFLATVALVQALGGGWTPAPLVRTAERIQ